MREQDDPVHARRGIDDPGHVREELDVRARRGVPPPTRTPTQPCPAPRASLSCAPLNGHIVAIGGGTFLTDDPDPRLDAFILALTGTPRPSVCYLGTAGGDHERGRTSSTGP